MRIFRVDSAEERLSAVTAPVLVSARPTPATLERQIQSLCEKNLLQLFGLEFIASEFTVRNVRLDTFAFDPESNSYVIIEYKRGASLSIIDQGFTYLSLLQNNPEAFVLKHAESKSLLMKMQDIDWRKSRVFFVSPDFTAYQRSAVNFKDFRLELYQISLFEDSLLCLERIGSADDATAVESSGAGASPPKSQGAPTVEEHLEGRPPEIRSLFNQLSTAIKELSSDILERPVHVAIFYEIDGQKFAEVILQQKQISVHLDFFDGDGHGLDVVDMDAKGVGHLWGVGPYKFVVKPNDQLKPALQLIAGALASMTGDRTP